MKTFPQIHYPFSYGINPHKEAAHAHALAWAQQHRLIRSADIPEDLKEVTSGVLFAAKIYPTADEERLCIASCWFVLFFIVDDRWDKQADEWEAYTRLFTAIMADERAALPDGDVFAACFRDIWQRMAGAADPEWLYRFRLEVETYLNASCWEARNFSREQRLDPAAYLEMRSLFSGGHFCMWLSVFAAGMRFPPYLRELRILQQIKHLCSRLASWANDLHSLGKELENEDMHNMVLLLQAAQGLTLQQAVEEVKRLHDEELAQLQQLEQQLPSFGPDIDGEIRRYVEAMKAVVSGNHEWATGYTHRYEKTPALLDAGRTV